jgi:DNA polymerase, archaea type
VLHVNERAREWLWGWDDTPGIVSVWAESEGRAWVWRRVGSARALVREQARFRPWVLLSSLVDLLHLGARLRPEGEHEEEGGIQYRELEGEGALRYLVHAASGKLLSQALLQGAGQRLGRRVSHLRELGSDSVLVLPPEEQYLVSSGRTYFRELSFDDLARLQFDLETTGLDPEHDAIFMVSLRSPTGDVEVLECAPRDESGEAALIQRLLARIEALDPDVIENHNLHGFDLPFLARRAQRLRVPIALGRLPIPLALRPARRGAALGGERAAELSRRTRFTVPGRELIDSLDAVRRHDFSARDLPGHGLKAVARHFGVASATREYVPGAQIAHVFASDPERVRRYAAQDVQEAADVARLLGGASFALARMVPRRYERLADAGAATGVLDPLIVRAYLRERAALPAREQSDGTVHSGAALHLFASGVATRIVKADVASLYPSLMREYRIGPRGDRLGVLLALVDQLVEQRLTAKDRARTAPAQSSEHLTQQALSAAMKLVVNSAYGYLGAVGLTRFADVHAANEVTRRGRALLTLLCRELSTRGVTLLEADTDGVYFSVPESYDERAERALVAEVGALLPRLVKLEFDGRYAAMLSHEPKNYALLPYGEGALVLRGVAFRSSRSAPYGEAFLRRALRALLLGDVESVRSVYVESVSALRRRALATSMVAARVRLTKSPEQYLSTRELRRELPYEAVLASSRASWRVGERVHVYRASGGRAALLELDGEDEQEDAFDPRDYDVDYYVRQLRDTFAARLQRALAPEHYAAVIADPQQLSLFAPSLRDARPVLTLLADPLVAIT